MDTMTESAKHAERTDDLENALRESMTPQAIVAIAAHLQAARVQDDGINLEIRWLESVLRDMIGPDNFNKIADEIGV